MKMRAIASVGAVGLLSMALASCSSPPEYVNALYFRNSCPHVIHATAINDSNYDLSNTDVHVTPGASAVVAAYMSKWPTIATSLDEGFRLTLGGGAAPRTVLAGEVRMLLKTGRETRCGSGSQFTITDSSICRPVDTVR
ncbi:hypothetical protein K7567_16775 [Stenotrophomonas maltophilia]|nr:hypothetical protein K7567_16775 [Stenotrophomonas maltophilia]